MSNDKLFNISNSYMLHFSINGWGVLMERREEPDIYLIIAGINSDE